MEAALRKSAFAEDWDPSRASQGGKQAPQVPFDLLRLTVPTQGDPAPGNFPFSRRGPSRWVDPEPAGKGTSLAIARHVFETLLPRGHDLLPASSSLPFISPLIDGRNSCHLVA